MRFRLLSGDVDFAVRRNTPESTPPTMNCATVILRFNDIGPDQRNQAIAEVIRKKAKRRQSQKSLSAGLVAVVETESQ
jgi:hypothetical protein